MGLQFGDQSGSQNSNTVGTSNTAATTTQNPTKDWTDISGALKGLLGPNGVTPDQQQASSSWANYLADPNNGVSQMIKYNQQYAPFTTPTPNTAANAPTINAQTGASMMDAYKNPYQKDVVDASFASYDNGTGIAANAFRAGSLAGGGSTGGAYGSSPVGAGVMAAQSALGRGQLAAGLNSDAFNTAAGYGQTDASRNLAADSTNASNVLNNNQFNARQGDIANQTAMSAIQAMIGNAGTEQQLGGQANIIQSQLGGTGLGNMINFLGTQVPAFGQDTKSKTDWNSSTAGNSSQSSAQAKL